MDRFGLLRSLARSHFRPTRIARKGRTYPSGRRLFVAAHKACALPGGEGYVPIHAGKAASPLDLGFAGDDTGDHISARNPDFSELTVLYWIWRNVDCDQVGLMHYRRFFAGHNRFDAVANVPIAACDDFHELDGGFDLVIPRPIQLRYDGTHIAKSVEQHYVECHHGNDLLSVRRAILLLERDYVDAYDFVMRNNTMAICNMFVGRKQIVDQYCAWLFGILFHVARRSRHESYETAYRRVFGFLAERLFNVWIARNWNELTIAYRPCVLIDTQGAS